VSFNFLFPHLLERILIFQFGSAVWRCCKLVLIEIDLIAFLALFRYTLSRSRKFYCIFI